MKVLVLGQRWPGTRPGLEAEAVQARQEIYCAPGNGGIAHDATCLPCDLKSLDSILAAANRVHPDLTVVGPELPLMLGVVDEFRRRGLPIFGPTQAAAQLEGSKSFAKAFMQRYRIPTARYAVCTTMEEVKDALGHLITPIVVKADGLAAGKGVVIAASQGSTPSVPPPRCSAARCWARPDGACVLEEFLEGEELSFLVVTDGERIAPLVAAQDHKRVGDGDTGPNTGGMGAYSSSGCIDNTMRDWLVDHIARPVIDGHARRGHDLHRRALLRADDDRARSHGAGIQLPLRRSGNATELDAPGQRSQRRLHGQHRWHASATAITAGRPSPPSASLWLRAAIRAATK